MELRRVLEDQGLSTKEARLYLALLDLHEAPVAAIARKARVKRPTAYLLLEALHEKAFVTSVKRGRTLYYRVLSPYNLVEDRYNKYTSLERALPDLSRLYERKQVAPEMSVFEGLAGIQRIMDDTLTCTTEIYAWADIKLATQTIDGYADYVKRRVASGIWVRGVFEYDEVGLEFQRRGEKELREVYLVPKDKFPFRNEINVYDGKVAIISHRDRVGVIIQNQDIADTQRTICKMGIEYAKLLEETLPPLKKQAG